MNALSTRCSGSPLCTLFSLVLVGIIGCDPTQALADESATGLPGAAYFPIKGFGSAIVAPDGVTLIVSLPDTAQIVYFDTVLDKELKKVEVDFKPSALAIQGKTLFVSAKGSSSVYALDLETGKQKKEYEIPGNAVSRIACHPVKGLVYASVAGYDVYSIEPDTGKVTKTAATGNFIAVDPVKGDFVYTGVQPPLDNGFKIRVGPDGSFTVFRDLWGVRALIMKFAVAGKDLKFVEAQKNASVNGYMMHLTPDGKRVMIPGGGGWRPTDGGNSGGYVTAAFSTENLSKMSGQAPHACSIAFHPVLNLGICNHQGRDLELINGKSFVVRQKIVVSKGGAGDNPDLLAFAGKGTKVVLFNGENPANPVEGLHFIPIELTSDERSQLEKIYGKLPPPPPKVIASNDPKVEPKSNVPAQPKTTPKVDAKVDIKAPPIVKAANGTVTLAKDLKGLKLVVAKLNVPFLSDRDYAIKEMPKEMIGGTLVMRDSGLTAVLPEGKVTVEKDGVLYMGIMVKYNQQTMMPSEHLKWLAQNGWTKVEEPFSTTAPGSEVWEWVLYQRPVKKGPILAPLPDKTPRASLIFVIK